MFEAPPPFTQHCNVANPRNRLVEEDKDARLQNDVSYKKFATLTHNPYMSSATAGAAAAAATGAFATAANPYGLTASTPWAARAAAAAGWENGLVGGMFGQQISSTLPSGPGPSQAAAIQLNHSSAVAAVAAAAAAEKAKNSQVCKTEE